MLCHTHQRQRVDAGRSSMMMLCLVAILRKTLFHERERKREIEQKERNQYNTSSHQHVQTSRVLCLSFYLSFSLFSNRYD